MRGLCHAVVMFDFHLHVWPHSDGTPAPTFDQLEQYCEAAATKGIDCIAITEHCTRFTAVADKVLPHWNRARQGPLADATDHSLAAESGGDLDAYVEALVDAQHRGLPLLVGLEVDYLPGAMDAMNTLLGEYPFDVLLGSVHWLDAWLFDSYGTKAFADHWSEHDPDEVYESYVDAVIELARSGSVDVLAHLDVIGVVGHQFNRLDEHHARLAKAVADSGLSVEISSAGWRKPVDSTYPAPDLLDRLVANGTTFTTASDGHRVEDIGYRFDDLQAELDRAGVDHLATFHRRCRTVKRR